MKEISGALIAITLVMSAVFIPVAFMDGPVGVFYRQFSLTLAVSIIISGINALTLSPALCAILLKNHHAPKKDGTHTPRKKNILTRFFDGFNRIYAKVESGYKRILEKIVDKKWLTLGTVAVFCVGIWFVSKTLPTGFIPTEDQGMIYVNVTAPPGATVERTEKVLEHVEQEAKSIEAVETVSTLSGYSLLNEVAGASYGMGMINLKDWKDRKQSVNDIIKILEEKTKEITDAQIEFFAPPTVPGFGNSSGFEFRLLDKTGSGDVQYTSEVTKKFIEELQKRKEIGSAFTTFDASFPQYMLNVDYDMAAKKGVTVNNAMETLQTLLGSTYATNFIRFNQMYRVYLQTAPQYRTQPADVLKLYVKNDSGAMVPFSSFVSLERVFGPEQLTRYNMYTSAMISGLEAPGYSSSDAIRVLEETAKEKLPRGFNFEWSGMTREQVISGNQAIFIFGICLVFVYLLLSAQYESFLLPLAVILSLPVGIFGSYIVLQLAGLENNIYAQVALVMLIGLLGKNAILIIEMAVQKHENEGYPIVRAAVEGAASRLRPILMTSFAFNAGLMPLVFAHGAGALGNRSIGTAAAGGMLIGTIFGIFVIPGLYVIFASIGSKRRTKKRIALNA